MYFTDFMYAPADADPPGCSKSVLTADAAPDRQPSAAQRVAGAETAETETCGEVKLLPATDTAQPGKRISKSPQACSGLPCIGGLCLTPDQTARPIAGRSGPRA
jgi:hypothetical protein